jgi:hypothetical protein
MLFTVSPYKHNFEYLASTLLGTKGKTQDYQRSERLKTSLRANQYKELITNPKVNDFFLEFSEHNIEKVR